ncbi:MAG: fibrillarin-like rRNA/tRNA 2'-O-methyltransferase [Candidatus Aenigmarchaeota archaeon]|nr:fibrillarin-like rRNA/tRNA 2'-O-methyltransferase [Candidatus Aenigmarchaeota archaeon]
MPEVKKTKFYGVFKIKGKISTINLVPNQKVYGEELIKEKSVEYRVWDFWRSKPAAAIKNGLKGLPIEDGIKVLYLGIANGTTASHFSDIIGKNGLIYGVEISDRPFRELIPTAEKRGNVIPILANARKPEDYENVVLSKVDVVYEDVASDDQVQIMIRNCEKFLKPDGFAIIVIKSQSIDVTKHPRQVYKECLQELEKYFEIIDKVELDPYEKFHLFVVMRWKG